MQIECSLDERLEGHRSLNVEEVLRRNALPLAVVDIGGGKLLASNQRFAQFLKIDIDDVPGLDFLSLSSTDYRHVLSNILDALSSGLVDSMEGRGTIRIPSGNTVEVHIWLHALDLGQRDGRALLAVVSAGEAFDESLHEIAEPDSERLLLGSLDHDWNFSEISPAAAEIYGWDPQKYRGLHVLAAVHPDDAPLLMITLGQSSVVSGKVTKRLRILGRDGRSYSVRLEVTPLCKHNPPRMAVAIWSPFAALPPHSWWSHPGAHDLSQRQLEVLLRVARRGSVRLIAQELFISQSTVRNHLSAIYAAFGVNTREELLEALEGPSSSPSD